MTTSPDNITTDPKRAHVSFSQYSVWSVCPHQWKLKYVDGLQGDPSIHTVFGTSAHNTIQHWLKLYYGDSKIQAKTFDTHELLKEQLLTLAKEKLIPRGLTTKEELLSYYGDGCNILDHVKQYGKKWFLPEYELLGVELPIVTDVSNNVTFKAYLDVVLYHPRTKMLYIYDLKTSTRGWSDYQKKDTTKTDQLLLYKIFYSKVFNIPLDNIRVKYIILKRRVHDTTEYVVKHISEFDPADGKTTLNRVRDRFNNFITETFDVDGNVRLDNLAATPSDHACRFCPFNNDATKCQVSMKLGSDRNFTKT